MRIAILTTGEEIMRGDIVDTNCEWLASRCFDLGHEVVLHLSAGDSHAAIGDALALASQRAECVLVTGGIGPTDDDMTFAAAAKAFGLKLMEDEQSLKWIEAFCERRGQPMTPLNRKQAQIPQGGRSLFNPLGSAPGVQVRLGSAEVFFLPGVPGEMERIAQDAILPWLAARGKGGHAERVLRCFGLPEATIGEKLSDLSLAGCSLGFRPHDPEVLLKIIACGADAAAVEGMVSHAARAIRDRLGDVVYAEGEETLPQLVGRGLRDRKLALAVAESCTGGCLADIVTDISGGSEYFDRGVVAYSNRAKIDVLGVSEEILRANGAVSREVALAMAEGVREKSGADIGLGVTGIAGPTGGAPSKPVGTVHIAIAHEAGVEAHHHLFARERTQFKQIVSWTALDLVRRHLL